MDYSKYYFFFICVLLIYFVYRVILVVCSRGLDAILKTQPNAKTLFITTSIFYFMFVFVYVICLSQLNECFNYSDFDYYMFFVLVSIISAEWCYVSIDSNKVLPKPVVAEKKEVLIKKVVFYFSIFAFIIYKGFEKINSEISISIEIVDFAIVAIFLSADRLFNSLWQILKDKNSTDKGNSSYQHLHMGDNLNKKTSNSESNSIYIKYCQRIDKTIVVYELIGTVLCFVVLFVETGDLFFSSVISLVLLFILLPFSLIFLHIIRKKRGQNKLYLLNININHDLARNRDISCAIENIKNYYLEHNFTLEELYARKVYIERDVLYKFKKNYLYLIVGAILSYYITKYLESDYLENLFKFILIAEFYLLPPAMVFLENRSMKGLFDDYDAELIIIDALISNKIQE